MCKEEWRLHKSLVGGLGSTFFPLIIFLFTILGATLAPFLLVNLDVVSLLLMLHGASLFYGLFVGGFGAIGEQVMTRRLGEINMLLQLPRIYPLSFRRVMAIFYVKDSIFYMIYTFMPIVLGILVASPLIKVSTIGVLKLGVTLFLTFMLGMGTSFSISTISVRSKMLGAAVTVCFLTVLTLSFPLKIIKPELIIFPLGYWIDGSLTWIILSSLAALTLAAFGTFLTKEHFETRQKRYDESLLGVEGKLGLLGELKPLVAKEWLELTRSGNLFPTIGGYTLPLLAVYSTSWVLENSFSIPIDFNVVFLSALVGFAGVLTYSSLTSIENNEYLNAMPVSVDLLIKAKMIIYLILTSGITIGYVVLIGFLKGELMLIPLGLIVAECVSIYVVAVTAYLTGLWTNTMFFGANIVLKFAVFVVPLLIVIEIGAMILTFGSLMAIVMILASSVICLSASVFLYLRLDRKWQKSSFSYVSTGQ